MAGKLAADTELAAARAEREALAQRRGGGLTRLFTRCCRLIPAEEANSLEQFLNIRNIIKIISESHWTKDRFN